nr:uncharacterized protein LOC109174248 [Ipomoea batatas]
MNHFDQWFWRKDLKGLYSVRDGYRELYGEAMQPDSCNFKSWNQLWRLKIPPKIKNFIWRCPRNILPVKTVLLQRRVEIPHDCPLCHKEVESRSHLFLDCEFSKPVWDNTILPLHILEASFESWLSQVVDLDDEIKSRSIIAILWTVWKNRNEYVWNNKQWNTVQRTQGIDASWVYCEVDASVIENSASFGVVIRTHSVRDGYRELYGEAMQPDSCNFKSWNQLWRLKIPPKIKNFIWRCARNILPVKTVLLQRRVEIPHDCPLCHKEVESRSHLFLDCEFSKPVWDNTILPLHILEASFESWLSQVVDLDDEIKSRSIIAILWTVWKNRNEYVWNNKQWNVNAIRISVTNCIKDWQCWCDLQDKYFFHSPPDCSKNSGH